MVRYKLAPVLRPPRPFHPPPPPVHRPPLMQFVCSFLLVQRVVVTSRPSRPQYQKSSVHTTCHVKKKERRTTYGTTCTCTLSHRHSNSITDEYQSSSLTQNIPSTTSSSPSSTHPTTTTHTHTHTHTHTYPTPPRSPKHNVHT